MNIHSNCIINSNSNSNNNNKYHKKIMHSSIFKIARIKWISWKIHLIIPFLQISKSLDQIILLILILNSKWHKIFIRIIIWLLIILDCNKANKLILENNCVSMFLMAKDLDSNSNNNSSHNNKINNSIFRINNQLPK